MVITNVSSAAISNLLQVCHDHQSDACSTGSNLSTFAASPPPKLKNNHRTNPGATVTSSECNLDTTDDHLSVREGEQVVRETTKTRRVNNFILENTPVTELITSQVRLIGNTPYVHIGVIFDDLPEKTAFDPQALKMEYPEQQSPALQRNFYFPISDQALSTNIEKITIATMDSLIAEFSAREKSMQTEQANDLKTDISLNISKDATAETLENNAEKSKSMEEKHEHEHEHKHEHEHENEHENKYVCTGATVNEDVYENDAESIDTYALAEYENYYEEYDDFNFWEGSNLDHADATPFTTVVLEEPLTAPPNDNAVNPTCKPASNTNENSEYLPSDESSADSNNIPPLISRMEDDDFSVTSEDTSLGEKYFKRQRVVIENIPEGREVVEKSGSIESSMDSSMPELQSRYCEDSTSGSDSVTTVQPTFCNTIGKNNNDTTPNRSNTKKKKIGTRAIMDTDNDDNSRDDTMNQGSSDDKDDGDDGMGENGTGDDEKEKEDEEEEDGEGDDDRKKDEDEKEEEDDFEIAHLLIRPNSRGLSESQVLHFILEEMFKAINENEEFEIHPTNKNTDPQPPPITCREQILVDGNDINAFFNSIPQDSRAGPARQTFLKIHSTIDTNVLKRRIFSKLQHTNALFYSKKISEETTNEIGWLFCGHYKAFCRKLGVQKSKRH